MADEKTPAQTVRDTYETFIPFWGPLREAIRKERAFLDGDRYEDDEGSHNLDRRRNQIRGQEIQDTARHIAAKVTEKPRSVEARPMDRVDDPMVSEMAVSLVEWETGNPWKDFEGAYESAIIAARESRIGIVWMDWVPDLGPFGEIVYSYDDATRYMWDPAFDPHHPLCGWLLQEKRIDADEAQKIYKKDWITPDRQSVSSSGEIKQGVPLIRGADGRRVLDPTALPDDNKATLWFLWLKNDKTEGKEPKQADDIELEEKDRFMVCLSGCGFRTDSQQKLEGDGALEEGGFPETLEQGCPTCGGNLERIDAKEVSQFTKAFMKGKRLIIIAPFSASPDDDPVYDGKWPVPTARSFPGLFLTAYTKPGMPVGPSDTTLMWDQQVALDNLRTWAVQRVFEHRNYWVMPKVGITDAKGQRFMFREDQFNVMYRDPTKAQFADLQVEQKSGTGLDPGFSNVYNVVQTALTQYRGITDLGITQETSKNIAASTVAQLNQMGEIPTAHFNRRKNRELGKFYGVLWDYIVHTYTPDRISRLRIDGIDMIASLSGDDLPGYDFVIEDTPDFSGLEKARADASQLILQTALNPQTAPFLDIIAEINNLPPSVVRKFEKRMEELQAQQAEQAQLMAEQGMGLGGLPPEGPDSLTPEPGAGLEGQEQLTGQGLGGPGL